MSRGVSLTYIFVCIFDVKFLRCDELEQFAVFLFLDAAECVDVARFQFHLEIETTRRTAATCEIHRSDFFEANVHGRLVYVNETAFQRIQIASCGFVGTSNSRSSRMTNGEEETV